MISITTSNASSGLNVGDRLVIGDKGYFWDIITEITDSNTFTIRKQKWYEDNDTLFLVCLCGSGVFWLGALSIYAALGLGG